MQTPPPLKKISPQFFLSGGGASVDKLRLALLVSGVWAYKSNNSNRITLLLRELKVCSTPLFFQEVVLFFLAQL